MELRGWRDWGQRRAIALLWSLGLSIGLVTVLGLGGCTLPQVSAEERLFLPLQVEFLDQVTLPPQDFADTPVGGLSDLAYDGDRGHFYALSDDRGTLASPRLYTLEMPWLPTAAGDLRIGAVTVTGVTLLRDAAGNPYAPDMLDPEGLALSPRDSWFVSSEGVARSGSPPQINEYDRATGTLRTQLPLPARYLPDDAANPSQGIRSNLGFEGLTLSLTSAQGAYEPFRLFTVTESALAQDFDPDPAQPLTSRFLHYLLDPNLGPTQSTPIAEHAYPLGLEPQGSVIHGITALATLDQGGHFLALERSFGLRGFQVKLWQLATGGATDTSTIPTLASPSDSLRPIRKQLVLDFNTLGVPVDNLEGMALGPSLPNGDRSLWVISDDNFSDNQTTQIWLFRLGQV